MTDHTSHISFDKELREFQKLRDQGILTEERFNDFVTSIREIQSGVERGIIPQDRLSASVKRRMQELLPISDAEFADLREAARYPTLCLCKTLSSNGLGAPGCSMGGLPKLPPNVEWPWYQPHGRPYVPMHFVAQINLASVPEMEKLPEFPRRGTLFFFFTPTMPVHVDTPTAGPGCSVIYCREDVEQFPERHMPAFPALTDLPFQELCDWASLYEDTPTGPLKKWNIFFRHLDSFAEWIDPRVDFEQRIGGERVDLYEAFEEEEAERLKGNPKLGCYPARHHMFGKHTFIDVRANIRFSPGNLHLGAFYPLNRTVTLASTTEQEAGQPSGLKNTCSRLAISQMSPHSPPQVTAGQRQSERCSSPHMF